MVAISNPNQPKFQLGQIVITPAAIEAIQSSNQSPAEFLRRHMAGDWGDLSAEDKRANDEAIKHEDTADTDNDLRGRVLSAYHTSKGEKLYVITEYSREITTILTPADY